MGNQPSGEQHPRWKGGIHRHVKGYLRYSAGANRGKMVHRVVVESLDKEGPCHLRGPLAAAEIHHLNWNRRCNCPWNLLVLFNGIHDKFSAEHGTKVRLAKVSDAHSI